MSTSMSAARVSTQNSIDLSDPSESTYAKAKTRKVAMCPTCHLPIRGHKKGICRNVPSTTTPSSAVPELSPPQIYEHRTSNVSNNSGRIEYEQTRPIPIQHPQSSPISIPHVYESSSSQSSHSGSFEAWVSSRSLPVPVNTRSGSSGSYTNNHHLTSMGSLTYAPPALTRPQPSGWQSRNYGGRGQRIPQIPFSAPIGFSPERSIPFDIAGSNVPGVSFQDVLAARPFHFAAEHAWAHLPPCESFSIAIIWPGYSSIPRMYKLSNSRPGTFITRKQLALEVVIIHLRWIEEHQSVRPSDRYREWKVGGPDGIGVNDLILERLVHVGWDTWQAELRLIGN